MGTGHKIKIPRRKERKCKFQIHLQFVSWFVVSGVFRFYEGFINSKMKKKEGKNYL